MQPAIDEALRLASRPVLGDALKAQQERENRATERGVVLEHWRLGDADLARGAMELAWAQRTLAPPGTYSRARSSMLGARAAFMAERFGKAEATKAALAFSIKFDNTVADINGRRAPHAQAHAAPHPPCPPP